LFSIEFGTLESKLAFKAMDYMRSLRTAGTLTAGF
jgi:hypothetical protein